MGTRKTATADHLQKSAELARVIIGGPSVVVTQKGYPTYKYVDGKRTTEVTGYVVEVVTVDNNFNRVPVYLPKEPEIFKGKDFKNLVVSLVNPLGEVSYDYRLKLFADDLADDLEGEFL